MAHDSNDAAIIAAYQTGASMREIARDYGMFVRDVSQVLGEIPRHKKAAIGKPKDTPHVFVSDIVAHATVVFGVPRHVILSPDRKYLTVRARQAVAWLARKHTNLSLPQIGKRLGGRDHSTICHAIAVVPERMMRDPLYAARVQDVESALLGRPSATTQAIFARIKAEWEASEAAKAAAQIEARERTERERWFTIAQGDKAKATRMRNLTERVNAIHSDAKPKNNFLDGETHDDGHDFMAMMAKGSAMLAARVNEVRAA